MFTLSLLVTFANSLDPDQVQQKVGPFLNSLDPDQTRQSLAISNGLDPDQARQKVRPFLNSLDPDQARQNVRPDLNPNCLTLLVFLKD